MDAGFRRGPLQVHRSDYFSPGYGWQGAEAKDLKTVFRGTRGNVLVTVSRFIASHGPDIAALSQATESIALDVRQALMEATVEGSENQ